MYSLLCVFILQYSHKVDFIPMDEAQMGAEGASTKLGSQGPLGSP